MNENSERADDYFLNYKNTNIISPDSLAEIYTMDLEKRFNSFDPASELLEVANSVKTIQSNEVLDDKKPESFDYQFDDMKYSNNPSNTNTNGVYHNGNSNTTTSNNNNNNNNSNENTEDEKKFDAFQSEKYFDAASYENKNSNQDTYNGNYNNYGGYDAYSYNDNNGMNLADNSSSNNPNSNQIDYPMSKENKMPDLSDSNTKDIIEDNSLRDTDILMADDNKGIFDMMTYDNMNSNNKTNNNNNNNNNESMLINEPNSNQADNFNNGNSHNMGIMSDDISECNYFSLI